MLKNINAFASFSVNDLDAARDFYQNKLGLEVTDNPMGLLELHIPGNSPVMVYPKQNHEPATYTILNFTVDNVATVVDELNEKGITMEEYPEMNTDEKGIHKNPDGGRIAWFKDPAGNILSVIETT